MRKFIGLLFIVSVSFTVSASSDYDVGHKYKSECLVDLAAFDVAILPESYQHGYVHPSSVTEIPVKITSVKPSKAVNVLRRARDAL